MMSSPDNLIIRVFCWYSKQTTLSSTLKVLGKKLGLLRHDRKRKVNKSTGHGVLTWDSTLPKAPFISYCLSNRMIGRPPFENLASNSRSNNGLHSSCINSST